VVVAGIVLVGALAGSSTLLRAVEPAAARATPDARVRAFVVRPGQSAADVADELERQGIIRSALIFRGVVEARGVGNKIEAGEYQLSAAMPVNEVVAVLTQGASRSGIRLTVPEGWRAEQLAKRVESLGLGSTAELMSLVQAGAKSAPTITALESLPPGQSLEGYLFPDTYELPRNADARVVVETMLRELDRKLTPDLRQRASAAGLTIHQVLTLASIVEREAAIPSEQPTVASVYLNRLKREMPLQADPTVQYAVANANPAEAAGFDWWKRELSRDDLRLASPYNSYVQRGLPPGPICSPGLGAIRAVLEPATTDYLYFVARGDGSHAFGKTEAEHRANVQRYRP
jgi:UPF0755 protein